MTANQKKMSDEAVLTAILDRIGRRTREEWVQMIESYAAEDAAQSLPPLVKSTPQFPISETQKRNNAL